MGYIQYIEATGEVCNLHRVLDAPEAEDQIAGTAYLTRPAAEVDAVDPRVHMVIADAVVASTAEERAEFHGARSPEIAEWFFGIV